jgi:hypothetical protein
MEVTNSFYLVVFPCCEQGIGQYYILLGCDTLYFGRWVSTYQITWYYIPDNHKLNTAVKTSNLTRTEAVSRDSPHRQQHLMIIKVYTFRIPLRPTPASENHILIKWITEADAFTFQNNLAYRNVISKYNYFKRLTFFIFFILQLRIPSFEVYVRIRKSWH